MVYWVSLKGGPTYGQYTVHRCAGPPDRVPGFHQPDARRVSAPRPALRGGVPSPDGRVAPRWETPVRIPRRLLLDSRGVDVPMAYSPTLVILSSLKPLFFNSLKK